MGVPIALPAINTLLQVGSGTSPETFATIANVSSINGLSMSATVVDVTSMSTGNPWREKVVTLLDAGSAAFDIFWIPSTSSAKNVLTLFGERGAGTAGVPIDFRLVFPDVGATTYSFAGFFDKIGLVEAVADVCKAAVSIVATGPPTFPA
jgi:hypothetical protein